MSPILKVIHLDRFPYGGRNQVQFKLGELNVTEAIAKLLDAYWSQYCDLVNACEIVYGNCFVETGESFGEEDFAESIRDFISIEVVSVPYEG